MEFYIIPVQFMNELNSKPNEWKILWLRWIADGKFYEPNFIQTQKFKNIEESEVVACFNWGYAILKEGIRPNQLEHKYKISVFDDNKAKRKKIVQAASKIKKEAKPIEIDFCRKVISLLNEVAGTAYNPDYKAYHQLVLMRMSEGYVFEDFQRVIGTKVKEWKGTDFEQYIRPLTLFGEKFDQYLNKAKNATKRNNSNSTIEEAMRKLSEKQ